ARLRRQPSSGRLFPEVTCQTGAFIYASRYNTGGQVSPVAECVRSRKVAEFLPRAVRKGPGEAALPLRKILVAGSAARAVAGAACSGGARGAQSRRLPISEFRQAG